MSVDPSVVANVKEVVPFLNVYDMQRSVQYYVDGLGFAMTNKWVNGGKLRWCWLTMGGAALMLQEFNRARLPQGKLGEGVSVVLICQDALTIYREVTSRGIEASDPQVGNGMWNFSLSTRTATGSNSRA